MSSCPRVSSIVSSCPRVPAIAKGINDLVTPFIVVFLSELMHEHRMQERETDGHRSAANAVGAGAPHGTAEETDRDMRVQSLTDAELPDEVLQVRPAIQTGARVLISLWYPPEH